MFRPPCTLSFVRRGFTLIELLVVIAVIAILAAMLFPALTGAREKSYQATCISNQRQLVVAAKMYAEDHDSRFPERGAFWPSLQLPAKMLRCKSDDEKAGNSYVFNVTLADKCLPCLTPNHLVITDGLGSQTESENDDDIALRHHGKSVVGWGDGHVSVETFPSFTYMSETDMAGRPIHITGDVKRIVLVRGRDIYSVAALLGDDVVNKVVAWGPDIKTADMDCYNKYTATFPQMASIPILSKDISVYTAADVEAVVALKPDLVVMDVFMITRRYPAIKMMENAGLPLVFIDQSTDPIRSPLSSILLLGKVLRKMERAREIVKFANAQIATVSSRLPSGGLTTVYVESGDKGPTQFSSSYGRYGDNQYTSWGSMLYQCHVDSIANGLITNIANGMNPISPEAVLNANPDVILITGAFWTPSGSMRLGYGCNQGTAQSRLNAYLSRPGWSSLKAVQNKRVYSLQHHFTMHIHSFAAYQQLAKWCYPDIFTDLKPEETFNSFCKTFYPVPHSGTWMVSVTP